MMNRAELIEQIRPNDVYDLTLPWPWVKELHEQFKIPYHVVTGNFVWLYDEGNTTFGRPFPITMAGWVVCKIINEKWY